jgi:RNA polymerase sigma-70 factor (ECF subfamily)
MVLDANDQELTEACQRGDRDAFRQLFEGYKDKVYSIALRYSGDPSVAMDIAQDTFLKLFSSIRDFRRDANFESWLYRMVVNRCLDHYRGRRRLTALLDLFRAPDETALSRLLRSEKEREVQRVVAKLPGEQRIVVILRYSEGLSYEEIAEILNCSIGTVSSRLNRAHKILERRLSHLRGDFHE